MKSEKSERDDSSLRCSACDTRQQVHFTHPLLYLPICETCNYHYHNGEFTIENQNEIYCRWCGEGEGNLFLCDTCPKSFCSRCIANNFGTAELQRIKDLSDRWSCFICSPQALRDLCRKRGWKTQDQEVYDRIAKKARGQRQEGLVCYDITRGREKIEIPAINDVDDAPAPLDFVYITEPVSGEGGKLTNNPSFLSCCDCTDNCSDRNKCQCAINSGGLAYDNEGRLLHDKPAGIYECNNKCACNVKSCLNRVVSRGPRARLEIFRCSDPRKGWGVRCKNDIQPGTFIADYIGEMMPESETERRGLTMSDEYLFTLDSWARSKACQTMMDLGIKRNLRNIPRQYFVNSTIVNKGQLLEHFDEDFVKRLDERGVLDRASKLGRLANRNPAKFLDADRFSSDFCTAIKHDDNDNNRQQQASSSSDTNQVKKRKDKVKTAAGTGKATSSNETEGQEQVQQIEADRNQLIRQRNWMDFQLASRNKLYTMARSMIIDRSIVETEDDTYIIDAR